MPVILDNNKLDKMLYQLAKMEIENSLYPESWHGMMICSSIEYMSKTLSLNEVEEYYIAVFGEEEYNKL